MNNQPNTLKYNALEASVYCPNYSEEKPIDEVIISQEFDVEKAKDHIKNSVALLSYNKSHKPLIIEILDVLDQYKSEFLVEQQQYICFYWSGILVYKVTIKKDNEIGHKKELHVSLQKYKNEKENMTWNRNFMYGVYMAGVAGVGIIGAKYFGNRI